MLASRVCSRPSECVTIHCPRLQQPKIHGTVAIVCTRWRVACRLVGELAPVLLDQPGIGPICAAQIICAWSHHGRLRSEVAFAALAGVAPIPASSGQVIRHRLNRGDDRQLNRALHTIVV